MSTFSPVNSRDAFLLSEAVRLKQSELPPNFQIPGLKRLTLSQSAPYFTTEPLPSGKVYGPTEITITAELVAITGSPVFTVVSGATRLHPGTSANSRVLRFDDLTSQSVVVSVSVEDTSTFKETPTDSNEVFTAETVIAVVRDGIVGADGADGAQGFHGVTVSLSMGVNGFHYRADGTSPFPETTVFTAEAFNLRAGLSPYYEFYKNDELVQASNSNTLTYTPPANAANLPDKLEVSVKENGPNSAVVARDMYVVGGVVPGSDAINVFLSNQAHAIPVTASGLADYTGSGTTIEVYEGDVRLTPTATDTGQLGTYFTSTTASGITPGNLTPGAGKLVVEDHEALVSDVASVTYSFTVNKLSGEKVTVVSQQSLTRAVQGQDGIVNQSRTAGVNHRAVSLITSTPVVVYTDFGVAPAPESVDFTTSVKNFDPNKTLYYQFFVNGTAVQNGISGTFQWSPPDYYSEFSTPVDVLVKVREGSTSGPVLAQDLVTLQSTKQGDRKVVVALSNASHAIPVDFADVPDYSGSGTDIIVYEGGTRLKASAFGSGSFTVTVGGVNITPGNISIPDNYTYRLSNAADMVSDQAVLSIGVGVTRLDGSTLEQRVAVQKFSKSREVVDGQRGPGHFYATGTTWSDATANNATPGGNIKDDVVTISNGSTYAMTKIWTGSAWAAIGTVIDGNLLVAGSVSAAKINTNGLSVKDTAGNVILDANAADGVHIKNTTIDGALIKAASIKSAAIQNAAIDSARIADGAITTAKIGDVIQSSYYVKGAHGWSIQKNGLAEFNNVTVRGTMVSSVITGSTIKGSVIDGGLFIGGTTLTVPTQADTGNTPRYLAYATANCNVSGSVTIDNTSTLTVTNPLKSASYIGEGTVTYDGYPVYKNFERYVVNNPTPRIICSYIRGVGGSINYLRGKVSISVNMGGTTIANINYDRVLAEAAGLYSFPIDTGGVSGTLKISVTQYMYTPLMGNAGNRWGISSMALDIRVKPGYGLYNSDLISVTGKMWRDLSTGQAPQYGGFSFNITDENARYL